jgi:hypothetical protein
VKSAAPGQVGTIVETCGQEPVRLQHFEIGSILIAAEDASRFWTLCKSAAVGKEGCIEAIADV